MVHKKNGRAASLHSLLPLHKLGDGDHFFWIHEINTTFMSSTQEHGGNVSTNEKQLKAKAKHEEVKARKAAEAAGAQKQVRAHAPAAAKPVMEAKRARAVVPQNRKPVAAPAAPKGVTRAARLLAAMKKPIVNQSGKRVVPK